MASKIGMAFSKAGKKSPLDAALGGPVPGLEEESMESEEMPEMDEDEASGREAEIAAMRLFSKAATPEAKVDALKAFLEACGVYSK